MNKKTLVFGASLNTNRYSNYALKKLKANEIETVAFGLKEGEVSGIKIDDKLLSYNNIHTITLYLNSKQQEAYYKYLVGLKPVRIIFNPGTENPDFYKILKKHNIAFEESCTLVLLSTNQY